MYSIYLNSSGQPVQRGEVIRDLKLCGTYKRVAERPQDFWEGDLAQDIEADLRDQRGIVEASDLRNYRPIWKVCCATRTSRTLNDVRMQLFTSCTGHTLTFY